MKWIQFIKGIFGYFGRKGYSLEQPIMTQMIRIRCANPKCPAHEEPFKWDLGSPGEVEVAQLDDKEAKPFIVKCPICGTNNKILLKINEEDEKLSYLTKTGITKRPPDNKGPSYVDIAF